MLEEFLSYPTLVLITSTVLAPPLSPDNVKAIQFATVADVSQLTLAQPTSLAKFSLCFAAEGSGTLLHYIGAASLTNKDLIIHISKFRILKTGLLGNPSRVQRGFRIKYKKGPEGV